MSCGNKFHILEIRDLSISFRQYEKGTKQVELPVISRLNVTVHEGEIVAVVGSSGSGKSLLAHAILGLLPANAACSGDFFFLQEPLTPERMGQLRGKEIALVPQSVTYLDPLMKVGKQVRRGRGDRNTVGRQRELFAQYGLSREVEEKYPFACSGGMSRRILLATALMEHPRLIIADEPTPGMELSLARKAMEDFRRFADDGNGVLLITHDIELALQVADRIAGALVDAAYRKEENPRIAVEVLIGHGVCHIIAETSVSIPQDEVESIVHRIAGNLHTDYLEMPQDGCLANNQAEGIRCGDNGIFKGVPVTEEQKALCEIAKSVYHTYPSDGKYIIDEARLILCQSNAPAAELRKRYPGAEVNPLGDWTGGTDVDSGATNRKLGSDMADSVTGGGLHGKDLSKADVSVNIYAWLKAQETGKPVELCCAIGDDTVDSIPYAEIVETARRYILSLGGFEKFAEWGLVR